jgi:hypothetical protein
VLHITNKYKVSVKYESMLHLFLMDCTNAIFLVGILQI